MNKGAVLRVNENSRRAALVQDSEQIFHLYMQQKKVASNTFANKTFQLRQTQTESSSDDAQDHFAIP